MPEKIAFRAEVKVKPITLGAPRLLGEITNGELDIEESEDGSIDGRRVRRRRM